MAPARIPLSEPLLDGNEAEYLRQCIEERWVATGGRFARAFEETFAAWHGADAALATASGTAALHVALAALGVGPGDEVVVPTLTFVASANPVRYVGATPVLADVDPRTLTLDPESFAACLGPRTRAVVVVHLYGQPADMDAILALAREHGVAVVEDATEALGSRYRGRACGTLGDVGCFSFNGNKVITSGGGGMVLDADRDRLALARRLTLQGRVPGSQEYLHEAVGFNYAMSNLHAAVGLAQMERLEDRLGARRRIAARYEAELDGVEGLEVLPETEWADSNRWLTTLLVDPERYGEDRASLLARLGAAGIEARPLFHPLHRLELYRECARGPLSAAEHAHAHGLNLPSSAGLTPEDQDRVVAALRRR